ncbi:MAG: aspartate carbamoyltransferase catalytic subunit [Candidatus Tectomicrobia bacterium]|nr:aspartate carbamoyltransferase catalytic subunit [Candidatus Tectomicrobia bacterium]
MLIREADPEVVQDVSPSREIVDFHGRDLLGMEDLTATDICAILDSAASFKEISEREIKKVPTLRGKTIINLFFEPSTRTRTSFEIAGKRLSADVINISVSTSSLSKGETLRDTADNLAAMRADVLVVRHSAAGVPHMLARFSPSPVINAGDGAHEHPTQALLDLYTIREKLDTLEGRRVVIVGDIANSRVARSNIIGMRKLGMEVDVCAPRTMIPVGMESWGVDYHSDLDAVLPDADVVMMLRIQRERHGDVLFPSLQEYSERYCLTSDRMRRAKPEILVMHPGPMNRGVEIAPEVADGLESVILQQVTNGVAVRMALLYLIIGSGAN